MSQLNITESQSRMRVAGRRTANYSGVQSQLIADKARLMTTMADAGEYLEYKDQVLDVLNVAQYEIQAKTQDTIAALLTQLIREVVPGKEDRVILEQGLKANKNTLEFVVESADGKRENIYLDKGGSIQNIISMGLRFVMLSRTRNRRILCLDESDCWLSTKYIPGFAKIMSDLSARLGVQVIYISHHNPAAFDGLARRIHLTKEGNEIIADVVDDYKPQNVGVGLDSDDNSELFEDTGWNYIRLSNYRGHGNTVLELSPGLNVITGDVDLGKSAIIEAIDSIIHNTSNEGAIRHGHPEARVEIGLEDGLSLQWCYKRRGAKKTEYRLIDHENVTLEYSNSGNEVPDWLHSYLAMEDINGMSLHIGSQDSPNFLIDKSVSTHFRAEALSLNADSRHIQAMIRRHGEKSKEARREINQGQKDLVHVKNKLGAVRNIIDCEDIYQRLESISDKILSSDTKYDRLGFVIGRLETLKVRIDTTEGVESIVSPETPSIADAEAIKKMGVSINRLSAVRSALDGVQSLLMPICPNIDINSHADMSSMIQSIKRKRALLSILDYTASLPATPQFSDPEVVAKLGVQIDNFKKSVSKDTAAEAQIKDEIKVIAHEKDHILTSAGSCPTCERPYQENSLDVAI
jgi:predicted ATPase